MDKEKALLMLNDIVDFYINQQEQEDAIGNRDVVELAEEAQYYISKHLK